MPRKRIFIGFGKPGIGSSDHPKLIFYRAAGAAWLSFLLFWKAVGNLLAQDAKKQHVSPSVQMFQGFTFTVSSAAACYAIWQPAWLVAAIVGIFVLATIEEMFTTTTRQ